jgi:MFS family permease
MRGRLEVFATVFRNRNVRRAEAGYFGFIVVENATWIAVLVYASERGGVAEAGLIGFVQLVPAALIAPLASFAGDRFRRDRVVTVGYAIQVAAAAVTAATMLADAPAVAVYAAATCLAIVVTFSRPAMGALLPGITNTPEELSAATVAAGLAESGGAFAGPGIAAVTLAVGSPATVFVVAGAVMAAATLSSAGVQLVQRPFDVFDDEDESFTIGSVHVETMAGLAFLRKHRGPRVLVGVMAATSVVVGAADVAYVAVALDILGRDGGVAGLLGTASGVGSVLGAAAAVLLIGRRRLTPAIIVGTLLSAAPFAVLAAVSDLSAALVLFAIVGVGVSITAISGHILLQSLAPDDVMARVFGVVEGMHMGAQALGALLMSVLGATLGLRTSIAMIGLVLPVTLAVRARTLTALDRHRPEPDLALLALLRTIPMFAPLPAYTLEQLLANLRRREPVAGEAVITKGEVGVEMYIVAEGSARIVDGAATIESCQPGGYFGEVAILSSAPRNATVIAESGLVLYSLDRDVFLEAVTGHPRCLARANRRAAGRTGRRDVPTDD